MHLHELFVSWPQYLTHRQGKAWKLWLEELELEPDKRDLYLMQIARRISQVGAGLGLFKGNQWNDLDTQRLKVVRVARPKKEQSKGFSALRQKIIRRRKRS